MSDKKDNTLLIAGGGLLLLAVGFYFIYKKDDYVISSKVIDYGVPDKPTGGGIVVTPIPYDDGFGVNAGDQYKINNPYGYPQDKDGVSLDYYYPQIGGVPDQAPTRTLDQWGGYQ